MLFFQLTYFINMRFSHLLISFCLIAGTAFSQNAGTALFNDARFDWIIGKALSEFERNILVVPVTDDSVKRQYYPYDIHGRIQPDKPLLVAGKFPVTEAVVCVDKNKRVSALIFYVRGDGDSVYAMLKENYGPAQFRSYINTDEAFGTQGKPVHHMWKIKNAVLGFTFNTYSTNHVISFTTNNVNDYMKTSFDKKY